MITASKLISSSSAILDFLLWLHTAEQLLPLTWPIPTLNQPPLIPPPPPPQDVMLKVLIYAKISLPSKTAASLLLLGTLSLLFWNFTSAIKNSLCGPYQLHHHSTAAWENPFDNDRLFGKNVFILVIFHLNQRVHYNMSFATHSPTDYKLQTCQQIHLTTLV